MKKRYQIKRSFSRKQELHAGYWKTGKRRYVKRSRQSAKYQVSDGLAEYWFYDEKTGLRTDHGYPEGK